MKTNYKFIFCITLIFTLAGCKKFFDLERPPQSPWTTVSEFERSVIGGYNRMFSNRSWSISYTDYSIVSVSQADDVDWVNTPEWGYLRNQGSPFPLNDNIWVWNYQVIADANDALEFAGNADGNPYPEETEFNKTNNVKRIIGELHFLRGFAYYMLMNIFGHPYVPGGDNSKPTIPLITTYAKSVGDAKGSKIGSTQEVFDQMLTDFAKAKELLPERFIAGMHPSYQAGRANKFAAAAMLARTHFLMGDYAKAKTECDFVISQNGGDYDLSEDPIAAWNKSELARGKEVIMYIPFYDALGNIVPHNFSVLNNTWGTGPCGWVEPRMANSTIKKLGWMDDPTQNTPFKTAALRDKRFTQVMAVRYPASDTDPTHQKDTRMEIKDITTIWNWKYYRGPKFNNTNLPIIRLAEMYLTRAACRFKSNDAAGAAADLNVVRQRAWNTAVGGAYAPLAAGGITQEVINNERLIEMFGEPDRVAYLRGLKVDIGPGDRNVASEPYTSEKFIWVKPLSETDYR